MNESFVKKLTGWYDVHKRNLPWRETKDPYKIWISEIMLQQTRVAAVIGYYRRFLDCLPTIPDLAQCDDQKLLKLWEGLGYYNRARNLKKAAEQIVQDYEGVFPDDFAGIRNLPGIGSYTAGAIGSIAFGIKEPAVDGNVLRVWARYTGNEGNILSQTVKKKAEEEIRQLIKICCVPDKGCDPGIFNQSLIELGALVCLPNGSPLCDECPVSEACAARLLGKTGCIPVREKSKARRIEEKTVLLIRDGTKTAIEKRPDRGLLAGMYEFPCIKGHVSSEEAVAFVRNEGYDALHVCRLPDSRHIFSHLEWHMIGYEIKVASDPTAGRYSNKHWIFAEPEELRDIRPVASAYAGYMGRILS